MKYDELKCHDCGKHLGSIIDTGPRGMSFCDKHSDVDTRPQAEQATASCLSKLLCGESYIEQKNEILDRMKHFYMQTDETYKWPNSAEGDLLKMVYGLLTT